jgi:hypothetical protein
VGLTRDLERIERGGKEYLKFSHSEIGGVRNDPAFPLEQVLTGNVYTQEALFNIST